MTHPGVGNAQQITERLRAEKGRLEDVLSHIARKDPDVSGRYDAAFPDYGRDPESNALEEERYESRVAVERSLERQLQDVNEALARVTQGVYGTCVTCGKEIDAQRLAAFPAAAQCIEHA